MRPADVVHVIVRLWASVRAAIHVHVRLRVVPSIVVIRVNSAAWTGTRWGCAGGLEASDGVVQREGGMSLATTTMGQQRER